MLIQIGGAAISGPGNGGWGSIGACGVTTMMTVVTVPWTLSLGAAGRDGAVGEYRTVLTSTDLLGAGNPALRIDLFANGRPSGQELCAVRHSTLNA